MNDSKIKNNHPLQISVPMGLLGDNFSYIEKFGRNRTVASGNEEVIEDSSLAAQTLSTAADIDTISSSNAGDGQEIEIQGLDEDWELVTQTATLNGQTKVTLDTPLIRVFRAKNIGSSALAGDVYIYVDGDITAGVPDDDPDVRAKILTAKNQTNMAKYTIPYGYTGYLVKWYVAMLRTSGTSAVACDVDIYIREYGGAFRSKQPIGIQNTGNGNWQYEFPFALQVAAKSDIEVRATPTANADVSAGFTLLLIKDE